MSIETLEEYIATADLNRWKLCLPKTRRWLLHLTSHGVSPLMLSCYYKKPTVTNLLLNYTGDFTLFEAAAAGKLMILPTLVIPAQTLDDYADDGFTAFGLACYFGHYDVARYLVLKGADVNRVSNNGFHVYPLPFGLCR
jgi:ankyrin repeat protein